MQLEVIHNTATAFAQNTLTMGVIDHGHQIVLLSNFYQFIQRSVITIHRKNTISDHQTASVSSLGFFDHPLKIFHISVLKTQDLCS